MSTNACLPSGDVFIKTARALRFLRENFENADPEDKVWSDISRLEAVQFLAEISENIFLSVEDVEILLQWDRHPT